MAEKTEYVYLISSPHARPVKIGRSANPKVRLSNLQACSPVELRLLATFPGGPRLEKHLHQRFADFRKHGEWFDFQKQDPLTIVTAAVAAYLPAERLPDRATPARPLSEVAEDILGHYKAEAPDGDRLWTNNLMLSKLAQTSPTTAAKALKRLVAEGHLVVAGQVGRCTLYALSEPVPQADRPRPRLVLVHSVPATAK
ncbi:GIY-YIG nuclease family protein [Kitasatospora sp. NPDC050543]|uniref:GIY-YIG nuclease family protein n=1 Tax=Kitasatospora sp. NPDC050543 TaxID=3364054 RepID=UPI0037B0517E